jgi:O-antigen/teichoic acid export membrane protein
VLTDERRQDVRLAARGSAANYMAGLLQASIFLFHTIGARLLGPVAYGAYVFAWSVVELANKLTLAGLDKGVMRAVATARLAGDPRAEAVSLGTAVRVVFVAGALVCLGLEGLAPWLGGAAHGPTYAPVIRALAPAVWLWGGMMVAVTATMATRTMRYNLLVRGVAYPVLMLGSIAAWVLLWPAGGGRAMAFAHLSALAATLGCAVYAFHRVFPIAPAVRAAVAARLDRPLVAFSFPVGLAEVLNQGLYRADVIIVGTTLHDPALVAHYGACMLLAEIISSIRYAFDPILSPVVAETTVSGDRARLDYNLKTLVRWVTLAGAPVFIGILVFGDHLLSLWGPSYAEAFPALIVLAAGHLVNATLGLHQWAVVMSGRSRLDLLNNAVAFGVALGLALALTPRFGLVGAASATLAGNLVFRALQTIEAWRLLGVTGLSAGWSRILLAALASGIVQAVLRSVLPGPRWAASLSAFLAGAAAYFLLLAALGLESEERAILQAWTRAGRGAAAGGRR